MVVILGLALALTVVAIAAIRRSRHGGRVGPGAASTAGDDLWNAAGISGATGHAWLAGEHAAKARAVTAAARRRR